MFVMPLWRIVRVVCRRKRAAGARFAGSLLGRSLRRVSFPGNRQISAAMMLSVLTSAAHDVANGPGIASIDRFGQMDRFATSGTCEVGAR
jgi:hypothetical protein